MVKKTEIENMLDKLIGYPINEIGRAADLLWIHFGKMELMPVRVLKKKQVVSKKVGDWAIHIQCPWRLIHRGTIILSWRDMHYNPDGKTSYDWNKGGENRFDFLVQKINDEIGLEKMKVTSIIVGEVGSFSLLIGNEYTVDVFPDEINTDEYSEYWRLFQPKLEKDHFIVY
jgi:hypothetical protein